MIELELQQDSGVDEEQPLVHAQATTGVWGSSVALPYRRFVEINSKFVGGGTLST